MPIRFFSGLVIEILRFICCLCDVQLLTLLTLLTTEDTEEAQRTQSRDTDFHINKFTAISEHRSIIIRLQL